MLEAEETMETVEDGAGLMLNFDRMMADVETEVFAAVVEVGNEQATTEPSDDEIDAALPDALDEQLTREEVVVVYIDEETLVVVSMDGLLGETVVDSLLEVLP